MDAPDRIDRFSLAAHRLAVDRLRERPEGLAEARDVIRRWRSASPQRPMHCDPYWDEWDQVLEQGVEALEQVVCSEGAHAATLRSVSPLGRFISAAERQRMLREAREANDP